MKHRGETHATNGGDPPGEQVIQPSGGTRPADLVPRVDAGLVGAYVTTHRRHLSCNVREGIVTLQ
ncbi:unannotated protein [freshwater metagenome]|uniref:Unannotated protein n=1 Tax=freshwater metagenome TaxID=449393 RepID=A0A6J6LGP6_9ZZZZ